MRLSSKQPRKKALSACWISPLEEKKRVFVRPPIGGIYTDTFECLYVFVSWFMRDSKGSTMRHLFFHSRKKMRPSDLVGRADVRKKDGDTGKKEGEIGL